jgi:hypothetical protein
VAYGKPLKDGPPFESAGPTKTGGPTLFITGDREFLAKRGREGRKWYEENSGWPRAVAVWEKALS